MERRLAAILAADVVGYSRLMGADEGGTLSALRDLRATLFDPLIEAHNGRTIKLMGDGTLVEFASVVDAVTCAVDVQKALADWNAGRPQNQRLELRIGINLGDVIVEGDDLYGDGINIAARLESEAEPGGISVSQAVVQQADGKVEAGFQDLGEKRLKNIETPFRVFRVVPAGTGVPVQSRRRSRGLVFGAVGVLLICLSIGGWYFSQSTDAAAIDVDQVLTIKGPAIAALPFENLSGDAEQDLFARGMTEQLAAALTRFKGVRVLSRRATTKYADDLAALRAELDADYLLEGSIRRDAEKVRVTALLINTEDGAQIWTEDFEAELSPANIVEVQDKLAGKIAGAIADDNRGAINLDRVSDRKSRPSDDQAAFDCVLEADYWLSQEAARKGYKCLLAAVDKDPTFSAGWERLSDVYRSSHTNGYELSEGNDLDLLDLAIEAGRRAVETAPDSSDAHAALAEAYFFNGEHESFMSEAAKALKLNPNDAGTIAWMGQLMSFMGKWEEGVALIKKARAFNPSVISAFEKTNGPAKLHFVKDEYSEAVAEFRPAWDAYPNFWLTDLQKAYIYAAWGKQAEAKKAAAALVEKRPDFVIKDAVAYYRIWQFQQSYIDKMVRFLKQAGLPSGKDRSG